MRIGERAGEICAAVGMDEILRPTRFPQGGRSKGFVDIVRELYMITVRIGEYYRVWQISAKNSARDG